MPNKVLKASIIGLEVECCCERYTVIGLVQMFLPDKKQWMDAYLFKSKSGQTYVRERVDFENNYEIVSEKS